MTLLDPAALAALSRLCAVVDALRAPGGCPWDRSQTPATMRRYLLEEAAEVAVAVDEGHAPALAEELGDLLFNVLAITHMEAGRISLAEVCGSAAEKMVRRHPQVFDADHPLSQADPNTLGPWHARQDRQARAHRSRLDGVPVTLGGLGQAHAMGHKAAQVGLDWADPGAVRAKVDEELAELDQALDQADRTQVAAELGDVLFTLAQLARHLDLSAEDCARAAAARFRLRFQAVERLAPPAGVDLDHRPDPATLDVLWRRAKEETR